MRVISGKFRSRPLRSARGMDLRPTSDRLRETLFNVLTAGNPAALEGSVWLDLYAGTGAVGIEALSRGAGMVYFVDLSGQAVELIRENLRSLAVHSDFEVVKQNAEKAIPILARRGIIADFVVLDPPYNETNACHSTLEAISNSSLLKPAGVVIAEHAKRFDPGEQFGKLRRYRNLKQGDAVLSFYKKEILI